MAGFDEFPVAKPSFDAFPEVEKREIGGLEAGFLGAAQGMTANFSDEFEAGVRALFAKVAGDKRPFERIFDEKVIPIRELLAEAERQNPGAYITGDVAGAIGTFTKLLGKGLVSAASTTTGKTVAAATEGAAAGALISAGKADSDKLDAAKSGAVVGGALGPAGLGVGKLLGGAADAFTGRFRNIPQMDALKTAAQAAYKKAEDAGVVVSQNGFARLAHEIAKDVVNEGFDKGIHTKSKAALRRLGETVGEEPTLQKMDILRRVMKAATKGEPDDARIAGRMIDKLDDFLVTLKPAELVAGDSKAAVPLLKEARDLWSRYRKAETIDDLFERARLSAPKWSASGFENAITTEFRALAKNAKKLRVFTADEQAAIKKIATGGSRMSATNIARFLSRFAPTSLLPSTAAIGSTALLGPVGAAIPVAGMAGRVAATGLTKGAVRNASRLVRSGGKLPPPARAAQIADRTGRALSLTQTPRLTDLAR